MGRARNWTVEEEEYLQDRWGVLSLKSISHRLDRSIEAIKLKAGKLGLKDSRMNFDGITVNQLSLALDKSYNQIVRYWIPQYGFPARRKIFASSARVLVISYEDFGTGQSSTRNLLTWLKWSLIFLVPSRIGRRSSVKRTRCDHRRHIRL